jgi:hypothetical protein
MNPFKKLIDSIKTMTLHSQAEWKIIEGDDKRKHDVIARTRAMMRAASLQYRNAVANSTGEELQNLTRHWSPKRILATNKAFKALCIELQDVEVWNMLRGHERKFIAEAYGMI